MDNKDNLYYTAPSTEVFEEVKEACNTIMSRKKKKGYNTGSKNRIKLIGNIRDNLMFIVAMLDNDGLKQLAPMLSGETRKEIYDRLIAGDNHYAAHLFKPKEN